MSDLILGGVVGALIMFGICVAGGYFYTNWKIVRRD